MKINSFLHFERNKEKSQNRILLVFLALMIYGGYKNGLHYYFLKQLPLKEALEPFCFPFIGVFCSLFTDFLVHRKITDVRMNIMLGLVLGLFIPSSFPLALFFVLSFFFCLAYCFLKQKIPSISWVLVFKIITLLIGEFLHIPLENVLETKYTFIYGTLDTFLGRSVGDFGTTSIFLLLILYVCCATNYYYKKSLPICIYGSFLVCYLIYFLLGQHTLILSQTMNSSLLFLSILLASQNETSPALFSESMVYGILIGVASFVFTFFLPFQDGVYYAFFLVHLFWNVFFFFKKRRCAGSISSR